MKERISEMWLILPDCFWPTHCLFLLLLYPNRHHLTSPQYSPEYLRLSTPQHTSPIHTRIGPNYVASARKRTMEWARKECKILQEKENTTRTHSRAQWRRAEKSRAEKRKKKEEKAEQKRKYTVPFPKSRVKCISIRYEENRYSILLSLVYVAF